jgi:hypothetical protein
MGMLVDMTSDTECVVCVAQAPERGCLPQDSRPDRRDAKEQVDCIGADKVLKIETKTMCMTVTSTVELTLAVRRYLMNIWYCACTKYDVPGKINVPAPSERASSFGQVQYAPRYVFEEFCGSVLQLATFMYQD